MNVVSCFWLQWNHDIQLWQNFCQCRVFQFSHMRLYFSSDSVTEDSTYEASRQFAKVQKCSRNIWTCDSYISDGRLFRSAGRDVKRLYNPITLVINMNLLFTAQPAGRDVDLPIIIPDTPFLPVSLIDSTWFTERKHLCVVWKRIRLSRMLWHWRVRNSEEVKIEENVWRGTFRSNEKPNQMYFRLWYPYGKMNRESLPWWYGVKSTL